MKSEPITQKEQNTQHLGFKETDRDNHDQYKEKKYKRERIRGFGLAVLPGAIKHRRGWGRTEQLIVPVRNNICFH